MTAFRGSLLALAIVSALIAPSYATVSLSTNGLAVSISNGNIALEFTAAGVISSAKVNGVNIASTSEKSFYLDWNENGQGESSVNLVWIIDCDSLL